MRQRVKDGNENHLAGTLQVRQPNGLFRFLFDCGNNVSASPGFVFETNETVFLYKYIAK